MNETDRQAAIARYLSDVKELYYRGDATEHSYRPALQQLIHDLLPDYIAINERKRVDVGAPDLVIFRRDSNPAQTKLIADVPLGFVEAKDIVAGILDRPEHQEQIKRYMELGNVVHTDGLEFRFYFDKELIKTIAIAHVNDNHHIVDEPAAYEDLFYYLKETVTRTAQTVRTAKSLALLMADRARPIRRTIHAALEQDIAAGDHTTLTDQYNVFRETLIHDLSTEDFADIYAETIAYGLFAARYNDDTPDTFSLAEAAEKVPQTNPFLRQFFLQIAAYEKDSRLDWVLNNFAELFRHADVHKIMASYGKTTGMNHDPVTHFYETFLGEYDSKRRKARGVYYTPLPIVQHIVRAVDKVLVEEFGLPDGLADDSTVQHTYSVNPYKKGKGTGKDHFTKTDDIPRVQILDPATGTGTFLNETIKLIAERKQHLGSSWSSYVESNLLPRLHGFELLMAAYSMAHMRLGLTLAESGYTPGREHPRIGVYLTNTLEEPAQDEPPLLAMLGMSRAITEEAIAADKVKRDLPIMVVMGNPPYSGVSSNNSKYSGELIKKYKLEPASSEKLKERNYKWINNDYVKFIGYAEQMITKNSAGVVAMITDNSYLESPTFRGMRYRLARAFDKIYVLDLHGNSNKREITPDGKSDENVFDIKQGTSILICVKTNQQPLGTLAKVYHSEIYGKRSYKYEKLNELPKWQSLALDTHYYAFTPLDTKGYEKYAKLFSVSELFTFNSIGIASGADKTLVGFSAAELESQLQDAIKSDSTHHVAKSLRESYVADHKFVSDILYRPFDTRYFYYNTEVVERMRDVMTNHMKNENLALCFTRKVEGIRNFADCFVSNAPIQLHTLSIKEVNYFAPLYIYHQDGSKVINLNAHILPQFTEQLDKPYIEYKPEEIFDYIYASLHSPSYRTKYKEFIKIDFPRIPAPTQSEFDRLVPLGRQLRELHLMHNVTPYNAPLTGEGNGVVEKLSYVDGNVYINGSQYFPNVPETAWNFYIGGYQPAQKWLKDRKGRELSYKDVEHYQKIITILVETDRIMKEIG